VNESWIYNNPIESLPDFDTNNVFIALLGLESLPPHVVLMHKQMVYSFSVRGVEMTKDPGRMIRRIWSSRQCAIFTCAESDNENLCKKVYKSYEVLKSGASCIDPIVEILKHEWGIIPQKPYLHGLLNALRENKKLEECNVSYPAQGVFELKAYNRSVIDQRIEELSRNRK